MELPGERRWAPLGELAEAAAGWGSGGGAAWLGGAAVRLGGVAAARRDGAEELGSVVWRRQRVASRGAPPRLRNALPSAGGGEPLGWRRSR